MKFFRKKEVYVPTVPGFILLLLLFIATAAVLLSGMYPFLAQNKPLPDANIMILEGWLDDADLAQAISKADSNTVFVASGGPFEYSALIKEKTYAGITAVRLAKAGIPSQRILAAPAPATDTDRTWVSALAVRDRMKEAGLFGRPANIYTVGPHSRRSYLLYRYAFGFDAPLGVVSLESQDVDLRRWWRSSMAFKSLCTECLSLIYTHCTRWKYD